MNDAPDQTAARPTVVVKVVLGAGDDAVFERWSEATVGALAAAAAAGIIGAWRIAAVVESDASQFSAAVVALRERARSAGGEIVVGDVDGSGGLVLVLDPRVIILTSTITRMVTAYLRDGAPVSARGIPLSNLGDEASCLLMDSQSSLDTGHVAARICQDATVVRVPPQEEWADTGAAGGSLLEGALGASALSPARDEVASALGSVEPALLSVVMRTQGRRAEALRDALHSLAGQSDGRFELLLVVHDAASAAVTRILEDQPQWLVSRTRILEARGGTRSRPLNVGIAAATGSLISFLDDDDVVFGNWVATFLDGTRRFPRRLLRSAAAVQIVTTAVWPNGVEGHEAESELSTPYPSSFDLADHVRVNMTPFMAFAFPAGFFGVFGSADESLEVCEDWDLVLRAATVLGVADLHALTAVYRRWSSGGDSYTLHDSAAWQRDMRRVRDKLDAGPLLLPAGSGTELATFSDLRTVRDELAAVRASTSWRVTGPIRGAIMAWNTIRNRVRGRS